MTDLPTIPESTNRYCGPAAIAAIAGITPDDAADKLAFARDAINHYMTSTTAKGIKFTTAAEIKRALRLVKVYMTSVDHTDARLAPLPKETFKAWAARTEELRRDRTFLVNAGRHWRVVRGWQSVCGQKRTPHHTNCAVSARSQVAAVYIVG